MKKFYAPGLFVVGQNLALMIRLLKKIESNQNNLLTDTDRDAFIDWLKNVGNQCRLVNLPFSLIAAERAIESLNNKSSSCDKLRQIIDAIKERMEDELEQHSFYQIQPGRAEYYNGARAMLGPVASTAFPSSLDEVDEAGKCLAVGRSTACVFHLMRALSPVTQAIADHLSIPLKDNWGAFLEDVEKTAKQKYPDKNSDSDKNWWMVFADLRLHIRDIKDAWRNPSMHSIDTVYTEEKAESIFLSVKALMQKAAEKIQEKP